MKPDIVFYQQYATPYFGILALSSYLKNNGYNSDVIIDSLETNPISVLIDLNPRLIGISVLSTEHNWLVDKVNLIKKALPGTKIIVGGIHGMFYPEEILTDTQADLVCHSEGEKVLIDVIAELEKIQADWAKIQGLAYKNENKTVCVNERAPLVDFNDEIIEDRSIYYDRYPQLAGDTVHRFFSSRGCPFKCSFCYNSKIHELFSGKGKYVRQKSVKSFIAEILSQTSKYPVTSIFFYDDLFTFNKEWLKDFLHNYKEKIGIPFMCTTRANVFDEEIAKMLAEAGCHTASFGIETGNYRIRKEVLNKNITDEEIIRCGNLLKTHGIKAQTANMFCLPEETLEDAFKTIELNIKAKTDYAFSALFMPFPKTEIASFCINKEYLKPDYALKDLPYSFLTASVLNNKDKTSIINVHYMAFFLIKYPWLYNKITKKIIGFAFLNKFFYLIFLFSNLIRHKEERGISIWHAVRYAWRLRKTF